MSEAQDTRIVWETVRVHDRDRYLTAALAPRGARDALMTLYAFNAELTRIPDMVQEPMLGDIRLQWWRDALDAAGSGEHTGAPVTDSLIRVMAEYELPKPLLIGMIDARGSDLAGGAFNDLQAVRAYLQKTAGTAFALSARILASADVKTDRASAASALAVGLTALLRALPMDASRGRLMLPAAELRNAGVDPERVLAGEAGDGLAEALSGLRGEVRNALGEARREVKALPPEPRAAFAPLALVEPYLSALERAGHEPLRDIADINPLRRFWRLWRAARGGWLR